MRFALFRPTPLGHTCCLSICHCMRPGAGKEGRLMVVVVESTRARRTTGVSRSQRSSRSTRTRIGTAARVGIVLHSYCCCRLFVHLRGEGEQPNPPLPPFPPLLPLCSEEGRKPPPPLADLVVGKTVCVLFGKVLSFIQQPTARKSVSLPLQRGTKYAALGGYANKGLIVFPLDNVFSRVGVYSTLWG